MNTSRLLSPQEAKDRVQTEINEISQCLENKMDEMFTEIETLEEECLSKQRQKQKKIDKINALIEQTEELADNSLLGVQNRIITELQNELSLASIQESKCGVEFEWGFSSDVISLINSITLKRLDGDTDEDRTPPDLPTSPLASPDGSDTTRSILTSDAGRSYLTEEQYDTVEQTERGGFGGRHNLNSEHKGRRGFIRDGSLDGRSNRGGFGERTNSNRGGFGERTNSNRGGFGERTNSNRGGFGERTNSNRGGFGERTNSNREGFGGRTDSNRERRAPRDRHTANRERPNREPRLQTGLNTEGSDLNQRRSDKQRTYVYRQADRSVTAAQTEFPDNDIEDSINFVSENTRGRNRNSPIRNIHCKDRSGAHLRNIHDSSARSRGHPRDFHGSDSRSGRDSVSWDVD